jgi:hypothetical protein
MTKEHALSNSAASRPAASPTRFIITLIFLPCAGKRYIEVLEERWRQLAVAGSRADHIEVIEKLAGN